MEIKRGGSQPSGKGPDQFFTGNVRIDPSVDAPEPARILAASVTFEPGARTAWHTHPLGQTLIVTRTSQSFISRSDTERNLRLVGDPRGEDPVFQ